MVQRGLGIGMFFEFARQVLWLSCSREGACACRPVQCATDSLPCGRGGVRGDPEGGALNPPSSCQPPVTFALVAWGGFFLVLPPMAIGLIELVRRGVRGDPEGGALRIHLALASRPMIMAAGKEDWQ